MALDVDARRLGRDIRLDLDGNLRVTASGDLQIVEGRENLYQELTKVTNSRMIKYQGRRDFPLGADFDLDLRTHLRRMAIGS